MWRVSQWNRRTGQLASATTSQQPLLLPLPVALLHRLTLIVDLLAARQCKLDFRSATAVKIERQRHQCQSLASDRALKLGDLALLEQQFALAPRLMVEAVAVAIFGNVAVDQPHFLAVNGGIGLRDRSLAGAQRLDLGTRQLDPCLKPLLDKIIEARAPVLGHDLLLVELLRKRLGHWRSDQSRMLKRGVDSAL